MVFPLLWVPYLPCGMLGTFVGTKFGTFLSLFSCLIIGWNCEAVSSCSCYQRRGRWGTMELFLWDVPLAGIYLFFVFKSENWLTYVVNFYSAMIKVYWLFKFYCAVYTYGCCKFCGRGALLSGCCSGLFIFFFNWFHHICVWHKSHVDKPHKKSLINK